MVSPLFPSLTPRYIDEHWFHYDQLFEEDRTLSGLEKEYHNLISEIENRAYNNSQDTTNVYSDADDDDDDARDLLGAAVERQHVDQIKNENNDKESDEYADEHAGPLVASMNVLFALT